MNFFYDRLWKKNSGKGGVNVHRKKLRLDTMMLKKKILLTLD